MELFIPDRRRIFFCIRALLKSIYLYLRRTSSDMAALESTSKGGVIDGFTVRNAMLGVTGDSATISNNVVTIMHMIGIWGSGSSRVINNFVAANPGLGIRCEDEAAIVNNTVAGCGGAGIRCYTGSPTVANNIVAFNDCGIKNRGIGSAAATPVLSHNDVYGNETDYDNVQPGTGDISADPRLAAYEYGNGHIQPDSPCIDQGSDSVTGMLSVDIDGQPRIQGAHVDIGADESAGTTWSTEPRVVYVDASAPDGGDGESWETAYRTIGEGLEDVRSGSAAEVWVAQGTYPESISLTYLARLYGGFLGTEATRADRDPVLNPTTIMGDGTETLVFGSDMSTLDGFVVTNGLHGISCGFNEPEITECVIIGNRYKGITCGGTAGSNKDKTARITHNIIKENGFAASTGYGHGIDASHVAPLIEDNVISDNASTGIVCNGSFVTVIRRNVVTGNFYGIMVHDTAIVTDNVVVGQRSTGIHCNRADLAVVTNNTVCDNDERGIRCYESDTALISNNICAFNGQGISMSYGNASLSHNNVFGNDTDYSGVAPGVGDISVDPLFVDRIGGNYHLTRDSECVDAGWNDAPDIGLFDVDGELRIHNLMVDIGADEYVPATTINGAKSGPDGRGADLSGVVVTATFDGFFYVEADDRSCGIRVEKAAHGLAVGDRVDVVGTVQTNSDEERYIAATMITNAGTGVLDPVAMTNVCVGGGDWHYNPVSGVGQQGVTGGLGLNNIGLLVRTCGAFAYVNAETVTIDDGSGVAVKCVVPAGVVIDPEWDYVTVTGISSCEKVGEELHRLIRVRGQDDIVPM